MTNNKTAILIQSFWKNEQMALETRDTIESLWSSHPQLYIGGCKKVSKGFIECNDPNASWMKSSHESLTQLIKMDVQYVYFILEDHPPMNRCNETLLNLTLPEFMHQSGASYIGLRGKGQGTQIPVLKRNISKELPPFLVEADSSYLCNLSLHPGLWEAKALLQTLNAFIQHYPETEQTPWDFEKKSRDASFIDSSIKKNTYRVVGSKCTSNHNTILKIIIQKLTLILSGKRNSPMYRAIGSYYEGPYPILFAGLLLRGKENPAYKNLKEVGLIK